MVIRFSSIGDIVLTSPIIRCLKQQTAAEIHFVTKSTYAELFVANPYVDQIHQFEADITEIIPQLKKENFDQVIDLHRNLRSIRLRKALKKPSFTFPKLNKEKWLLTNFKWNLLPDVHIVDRYFEAVKKIAVVNDGKGLDHFIPDDQKVNLSDYGISEKYISFSIGAQYATKRLPNEQIIDIIRQLQLPVVLLGGPSDKENGDPISSACENALNLCGKLSIHQSASVIQQSVGVITHDTGLMHIAAALKKPIVSIWGNTVPEFGMYPYLPENPDQFSMHEVKLSCRPCSKIGYASCPKKHFNCMRNQDIDAIVTAARGFVRC